MLPQCLEPLVRILAGSRRRQVGPDEEGTGYRFISHVPYGLKQYRAIETKHNDVTNQNISGPATLPRFQHAVFQVSGG